MKLAQKAFLLPLLCLLALPAGPLRAVSDKTTKTKTTIPADLERVPRDAPIFFSVRVSEVWKNKTLQDFVQRLGKSQPRAMQEIEGAAGVPLAQVERVTFVGDPTTEETTVLVSTNKAFAKDTVLKTLLRKWNEVKHQGKTYYQANRQALYVVNDRLFLVGTEKWVKRLMTPAANGKGSQPLDAALLAAEKNPVVLNLDMTATLKSAFKTNLPEALKPLLSAASSRLSAVGKKDARVDWQLRFAKADLAKGERAVRASLELTKRQIAAVRKQMGMMGGFGGGFEQWLMKQADLRLAQAEAMLKAAKVTKTGENVRVTARLKDGGDALLLPVLAAGMAFPVRAMGPGGPGGLPPPPPAKK
jgi:hypothetical protein